VSNPEPEPTPPGLVSLAGDEFGSLYALDLAGEFAPLDTAPATFDLGGFLRHWQADIAPSLSSETLATVTAINTDLMDAYSAGYLPVDGVGGFFRWLFTEQGVTTITAAMVAGGALAGLIWQYAGEKGYLNPLVPLPLGVPVPTGPYLAPAPPAATVPWQPWSIPDFAAIFPPGPAPVTYPEAPPPASPTSPGGHIVKKALANVTPTTITTAGVDVEVAKAVSAAMAAETSVITQLVAQAIDQALGGLQPGQVKSALAGEANAITALRAAVGAVQTALTSGDVPAIKSSLASVTAAVDKLKAQMDLTEPSALDTKLNTLGDGLTQTQGVLGKTELAVLGLETTLNLMPTPEALTATGAAVTKLVSQMDLTEPSALDSHLNSVDSVAQDALRVAEDAEACCEAQTTNLQNALKDVGGSSVLSQLGKLAGLAFGLPFLLGIADTLLAIADMPAVIKATVWDAEVVSGYAQSAAGVVMADFDWAGGWANGG
jgi:hypothetical protein